MKLESLTALSPYCWAPAAPAPGRPAPPVRLFGSEALLAGMDDKVLEQITNVARLPGLVGPAMTMPDAHWGYGFPIGGVAAFDPEEGGIISAGGVGFDISCGIRCLRTNLTLAAIAPRSTARRTGCFAAFPRASARRGRSVSLRRSWTGAHRRRALGGRAGSAAR